ALKVKGVKAATLSEDVPTDNSENNTMLEVPGKESGGPNLNIVWNKTVDYDFFQTFQVPLLAGRYFDESHGGDTFSGKAAERMAKGGDIIITERALARLGFASPQEAIGK